MSLPNTTPTGKKKRSLGLRKSNNRATTKQEAAVTPTLTKSTNATSKSVGKISSAVKEIKTPPWKPTTKLGIQSAPASCTPYRLSLSKRVRDSMTKKRLEFHAAHELEKLQRASKDERPTTRGPASAAEGEAISKPSTLKAPNSEAPKDLKNRDQLIANIEAVEEEMQAQQRHIAKTNELQGEIERWRQAFNTAFADLQQKFEPYKDRATILGGLGISADMAKRLDE